MLVTIVDATDQRGKLGGSGVAIRNESPQSERTLQAKGTIIRNRLKEREKIIGLKDTICWTYVLQILLCLVIPRAVLLLHPEKRKTESRMSPLLE